MSKYCIVCGKPTFNPKYPDDDVLYCSVKCKNLMQSGKAKALFIKFCEKCNYKFQVPEVKVDGPIWKCPKCGFWNDIGYYNKYWKNSKKK